MIEDDEDPRRDTDVQAAALDTAAPPPGIGPPPDLAAIFAQHHGAVLRAAHRITGNAMDAEDVLQTVFTRLLRRRPRAGPLAGGRQLPAPGGGERRPRPAALAPPVAAGGARRRAGRRGRRGRSAGADRRPYAVTRAPHQQSRARPAPARRDVAVVAAPGRDLRPALSRRAGESGDRAAAGQLADRDRRHFASRSAPPPAGAPVGARRQVMSRNGTDIHDHRDDLERAVAEVLAEPLDDSWVEEIGRASCR